MAITKLYIMNFRGVAGLLGVDIAPITVFLGPNSSGKSTCIHALASLSQTIKLLNNISPLALDDQHADVHLGRFIDVIHTKSYADHLCLGFDFDSYKVPRKHGSRLRMESEPCQFIYTFKGTKRTQDLQVLSASYMVGGSNYALKRQSDSSYLLTAAGMGKQVPCSIERAFKLNIFASLTAGSRMSSFEDFMPLYVAQEQMIAELGRVRYLGPFRQPPQRQYQTRGAAPKEVGPLGESAVSLLAIESVQTKRREHLAEIATWSNHLGLAKHISVTRSGTTDLFEVNLTLQDDHVFSIADLGYGVSQVLPVLAQCSFAERGCTLLFEQPELHLHSIAARGLAKVFIETAKSKGVRILIETHSPELFKEFLSEMRAGHLPIDDFRCYRISRESAETKVHPIEIDPEDCDVYENWERGLSV
jgi:predicted ATPase